MLGWLAGMVFFAIDYAWVGHTIGRYIGAFGPVVPLGPALIEAPYFALAGGLAWAAYARVRAQWAPLAAAAAFALCEWLRSIGIMGAPFDQLGYTQADWPLKAIAAYAGTVGITFVLCVLGAYAADAIVRRTWRPLAVACAAVAAATVLAWLGWPARRLPPPTIRVAAVQGDIAQSLKWNNLALAVYRYTTLTRRVAAQYHPRLIVWPETVITTELNLDRPLEGRLLALAHSAGSTIVAGSIYIQHDAAYNALYVLQPDGDESVYEKRQLVPFAEWFPGKAFLSWIPYIGALNGGITPGDSSIVYRTTALPIGPLVCWESAFADLAYAQVRAGAQLLVVSTDDAWFGTTSGPYMHAQISQLRAIETGTYVIRAAATGISGIVAPDGTWQRRAGMERMTVVTGAVGRPVPTVFATLGPATIAGGFASLYAALLLLVPRVRKERSA